MLDVKNQYKISDEDRRFIMRRALHTCPYFYMANFPLPGGLDQQVYSEKIGINRDFYLTEMQANLGEVFHDTGALLGLNVYTGYNDSVYRFQTSQRLPASFIATNARIELPTLFDDRQFETFPFLIRQNDKIFAEIKPDGPKIGSTEAHVVFKGFGVFPDAFLDDRETAQINDSLAHEVTWEFFKITVPDDFEGKKSFILDNDKYPRLILGFGATNTVAPQFESIINVSINDISRRLRLTDTAIPLEFIAPRISAALDQHIYYLPVEYYFQPMARIEFEVENIWSGHDPDVPGGAEIAILTRTI